MAARSSLLQTRPGRVITETIHFWPLFCVTKSFQPQGPYPHRVGSVPGPRWGLRTQTQVRLALRARLGPPPPKSLLKTAKVSMH